MLRSFNIYVDTPCCVLTQEESKRLIHGSSKEKYEFFLKATGLKNIFDELSVANSKLAEADLMCETHKPNLERSKRNRDECKRKLQEFSELQHFESRIRAEMAKQYWDDVRTIEGSLEQLKDEAEVAKGVVEEAREALQEIGTDSLDQQWVDANADLVEVQAEHDNIKARVESADDALRDASRLETAQKTELKRLQHGQKDYQKQWNDATHQV